MGWCSCWRWPASAATPRDGAPQEPAASPRETDCIGDFVTPTQIEPSYDTLPKADPAEPIKFEEHIYRGLDDTLTAQCLAAANASLANLLDGENSRASVLGFVKCKGEVNVAGDDLVREARRLAALNARNTPRWRLSRRFMQLAEAEGRNQLYTAGMATFEQLRRTGA